MSMVIGNCVNTEIHIWSNAKADRPTCSRGRGLISLTRIPTALTGFVALTHTIRRTL